MLRTLYFVLWDVVTVVIAAFIPMIFRFGIFTMDMNYVSLELRQLPIDIALLLIINIILKLYNRVWTYASIPELKDCILSASITEILYISYKVLFHLGMPKSYYPINWMILVIMLCASRISVRMIRRILVRHNKADDKINVMVVGAGAAAYSLIHELEYGPGAYRPVCVIDDNPTKIHSLIQDVPVVGNRDYIDAAVSKYNVAEIIIAIPSATPQEIRELVEICNATKAKVKRLPAIAATVSGSLSSTIRDINYEDLLAREPIVINNPELSDTIKDATVMVTGGGGSIGSELVRQLVANKAKKVLIVDVYENTAYELEQELRRLYPDANYIVLIADVTDYDRMEELFKEYQPSFIVHAAAHKHVPLMEDSPCEAIKNNCKGTLNMCKLADKYQVAKMVLISTDKAVRPTNVMGASKRVCEMIIQTWNKKSETEFAAVRFGNVLGSNGSVIPLFLKQIEHGGPVTLTHKDITRFFMTIPEAVSLVLTAGLMAKGGEIFVLDMGEPVKIYDLACNLIRMNGYEPGKEIKIEIVGLRPGEKLYEELLMDEEGLQDTANRRIKIGQPIELDAKFDKKLDAIIKEAYKNSDKIRESLKDICPTYQPNKH